MFSVPRSAGGHPRIVIGVLAALLVLGAGAGVWIATRPAAEAGSAPASVAPPPRPPLVVVEDLPQLKAAMAHQPGRPFMGAILVARGGEVLFRQAYGPADAEAGIANGVGARFRLASVSKQFTAAAILKLQDDGRLSVDDPVCRWIQPCPDSWRAITLGHLMSHTSGIPDLMARPAWGLRRVTPTDIAALTADSLNYRPSFAPGSDIRYNNAGFNLLADVIERASGMLYADYLRTAFFAPLGMKDTGVDLDGGDHGLVTGYAWFPEGLTAQDKPNTSVVAGAGAVYSTLDDMLVWNRALHGGRLLSARSYAQMTADHAPADYRPRPGRTVRDWGYGLFVSPLGSQVRPGFYDRQIYHTGSWSGFRNLVIHQPEHDVDVIVLSNNYHQTAQVFLISQRAMAEALGRPFPERLDRD